MDDAFNDLSGWLVDVADELDLGDRQAREAFWHNYMLLQVYDLLSLYSIRITPYPLDTPSLSVSMMTRIVTPAPDAPEQVAKEVYYQARRNPLTWQITS
jgi:hypothetical protein